jgi:hypothetical protein
LFDFSSKLCALLFDRGINIYNNNNKVGWYFKIVGFDDNQSWKMQLYMDFYQDRNESFIEILVKVKLRIKN